MAALEKIHSRASFNEHQSLSRLFRIHKIGDRLFHSVIEDMKIVSLKAFGEFARRIGYQHANANPINANADGFRLLRFCRCQCGWSFLRGKLLRVPQGRKNQNANYAEKFTTKRNHPTFIQSTRRNAIPAHPSTKRSKPREDAERRLLDLRPASTMES